MSKPLVKYWTLGKLIQDDGKSFYSDSWEAVVKAADVDAQLDYLDRQVECLAQERDRYGLQLAAVTQERDVLKDLSSLTDVELDNGERFRIAHANEDAEWRKTATLKSALAHYECAVSNWSVCLAELCEKRQQLTGLRGALVELYTAASRLTCTSPYHLEGNDVQLAEALEGAQQALALPPTPKETNLRAERAKLWKGVRVAQAMWQNNRGDFYETYHCATFDDWCRAQAKGE